MIWGLFVLIFLYVCNWWQINAFLKLIVGPKIKSHAVGDKWIKSVVRKKTGLSLLDITILEDKRPYGMMVGLPFWPKMILSEGLYESFNKDELEWVILHEAGHCVLWHNLQCFVIEAVFIAMGLYATLSLNSSMIEAILLSLILGLVCVQVIRWVVEYVADQYSIGRVDNPRGVISAQAKLKEAYDGNFLNYYKVFGWNIDRDLRIKMAKRRLGII